MGGSYTINLDECELIGTHWIALYVNGDKVKCFGVEHIPNEVKKFIGNKNITNM